MIRSATTSARLALRRPAASRCHSTHASSKATPNNTRLPLPQQTPHTVTKQNQSTLTLESIAAARKARSSNFNSKTPSLTRDQVRSVFLSAAIPMIGFGFMDNFIMITAGSAIDNTFGVQMGLATMTAAAMGQVVSDVSGVLFGDTLARAFKVAPARLSEQQKKLASVGRLRLGGAVAGIILGCCLGASALQLIPDEREEAEAASPSSGISQHHDLHQTRDRLDRLQSVMHDVMTNTEDPWHEKLASCTLYARNLPDDCLPTPVAAPTSLSSIFGTTSSEPRAAIRRLDGASDPEVRHTLEEGRAVVFADTIYVPIAAANSNSSENVLGIVKIKLEHGSFYTGSEIQDAKRMVRNLGFFLNHMVVPN